MTPAVVLHRCRTPTDWLCPCGRVARRLRAEGLEVEQVREPQRRARREAIHALTGQDRLPVVELDGEVIVDSHRIVEHLAWRREHAA